MFTRPAEGVRARKARRAKAKSENECSEGECELVPKGAKNEGENV